MHKSYCFILRRKSQSDTGNIARTCAGTNTHLHLIKPLGFRTDDKMLKKSRFRLLGICEYYVS